ncbi:MAG: NADH-quinone oxidoreductase subunit A [Opitutales bacterium]|nr:NADH-quinone oxidoreductase subunit A [Opitutales bacterium]
MTENTLTDFFPVLVQVILVAGIAVGLISVSHLFGQRSKSNEIKDSAYECGLPAEGKLHPRFAVKFYVTAMLFLIFDIEVVYLMPWVLVYKDFLIHNIPILLPTLFFLVVLVLGLLYEVKKGALDWER